MAEKFPAGKVVEVVSHKCAVLVETVLTFSRTDQYTGLVTYYEATKIVPARIVTRGTKKPADYFCYEVGEKVLLSGTALKTQTAINVAYDPYRDPLLAGNEWLIYRQDYENFYPGNFYVLGAFYDEDNYDAMPAKFEEVHILQFDKNNFVRYDSDTHELTIKVSGDITINGKGVYLNG